MNINPVPPYKYEPLKEEKCEYDPNNVFIPETTTTTMTTPSSANNLFNSNIKFLMISLSMIITLIFV